jgi:ribose transport system substrate-binding protein
MSTLKDLEQLVQTESKVQEASEIITKEGMASFAEKAADKLDRRSFFKWAGLLMPGLAVAGGSLTFLGKAVAAEPPKAKFRGAYSAIGMQILWVNQGAETLKALGEILGFQIDVLDSRNQVSTQRQQVEQLVARSKEYNAVFIHPSAIGAFTAPVKELIANKVPVYDIDTKLVEDLNTLDIASFTEPDNEFMGSVVTEALCKKIGGKGNIVHTQGRLTHTGAQGRTRGFQKTVKKYPNVKVIDETPGDWDGAKVQQIWRDLLVKFDKIDAGFFDNDDMALAAYSAIRAAGREKQVVLGGVDSTSPALEEMKKGHLEYSVFNPASRVHGFALWAAYYQLVKKEKPPKFIRCDGPFTTRDNLTDVESYIWLSKHYLL